MTYQEQFAEYYKDFFRKLSAKHLLEFEQNLLRYMESDFFEYSLLADEVVILHELLRKEFVYRVSKCVELNLTQLD